MTVTEYLLMILSIHLKAIIVTPCVFIIIGILTDKLSIDHTKAVNDEYMNEFFTVILIMWCCFVGFMIFLTFKTTLTGSTVIIISVLSLFSYIVTIAVMNDVE